MVLTLQLQLLGDFRLAYGHEPVKAVTTERSQSLLAYLVLHSHLPQPRQRLAFYLWPELSDRQARANLRKELHRLRQVLPASDCCLRADTQTIQWQPTVPFTLDVARFRDALTQAEAAAKTADWVSRRTALEQAAQLYQGDLLPSCDDEWVVPERERLHQQGIQVLAQLITLLEDQQEYPLAIQYAQQLLRLDPLYEVAYVDLMRLYAATGDRSNALRTYHRCLTILREELGIDPSLATRQAYAALLEVEPEGREGNTESGGGRQRSQTEQPLNRLSESQLPVLLPALSPTPGLPLIGRESEWSVIQNWMTADRATPELLLLIGESGIGKTRLLEEIGRAIQERQGYLLWGRGFAAEMLRPYGAWIDAFRSVSAHGPLEIPAELSSLMPEAGTGAESTTDRSRLFDAVARFLLQLARDRTPVAVVLDDIQWLDEASIALLHYVNRLLSSTPVLFTCAARRCELEDNLSACAFLQTLRREQRLRTVELTPLDLDHTAKLAHVIDANLDGSRIFADSGGNPLFVLEVAHALCQDQQIHSENLEDLIQGRLQQLDTTARELIPWAAALGHSFSPTTLAEVTDCPLAQLLLGMEELERHCIIRPSVPIQGDIGYDFAHDIVRQVAYHQLSEPRRRLIHRQIAHVLNQRVTTRDDALMNEVANHAALGEDHQLAANASLAAAKRCLCLFAYAEASELAQRGLRHCQVLGDPLQVRLRLELLKVYITAGVTKDQVPALEEVLHQAINQAAALGLKEAEAVGLEALIVLSYDHDNLSGVHEHSLRAAETGRAASPATTARLLAHTGSCLAEIGREMSRAEALLLEAQSLAARVGVETVDIPFGLGCVRRHAGKVAEAQQLLKQGWQMAQSQQDHWRECICLTNLVMLELERHEPVTALTYCHELTTVAAKMGNEGSEGPAAAALKALVQYILQQPGAEIALEQSLITLRYLDMPRMLADILTIAAEQDLAWGRIEQAIARASEASSAAQIVDHESAIALAETVYIRALLASGQLPEAMTQFQQLQDQVDSSALSDRAAQAINQLSKTFNPDV